MGVGSERPPMRIAATPMSRAIGLANVPAGEWVMIVPCRDVHTFGVPNAIDIAFLDGEGRVLASYRDVKGARRIRHAKAVAVVERWSSDEGAWLDRDDRVALGRAVASQS